MWALSLTDAVYAFLGFGWGKNETKSSNLTRLGKVYEKMIMWSQKKYKIVAGFKLTGKTGKYVYKFLFKNSKRGFLPIFLYTLQFTSETDFKVES